MNVLSVLEDIKSRGKTVHYICHPGNAGDSLINVGFFEVAKKIGLIYKVAESTADFECDDIVILGGGGGLVPEWSFATKVVSRLKDKVETLVILPQTVRDRDDLLGVLGSNVVLCVRERVSYEYCLVACKRGARIVLDHDMAFHVDPNNMIGPQARGAIALGWKGVARHIFCVMLYIRAFFSSRLKAFRTDKESSVKRGWIGTDLSVICSFGSEKEFECYYSAGKFLRLLSRFELIETDRLHVAIGGAILKKKIILYDNSYFKCRAVYEYSLQDKNVGMAGV